MNYFFRKKISLIIASIASTLVIAMASFYGLINGAQNISEQFIKGTVLVSLFPVVLFAIAIAYQKGVIRPLAQLLSVSSQSLGKFQLSVFHSAKDALRVGQYIPSLLIYLSVLASLVITPNVIANAAINDSSSIYKLIAGIVVSSELTFAIIALKQIKKPQLMRL